MNNIQIVGRLTRDPEYTPKNGDKSQYCRFAVAVDNRFGDLTTYFDCIVFGVVADNVDRYLSKGRQVAVKGRHEQGDTYTDKNGNKRRSWTLRAEEVEFLGSRTDSAAPKDDPAEDFKDVEEDVPF